MVLVWFNFKKYSPTNNSIFSKKKTRIYGLGTFAVIAHLGGTQISSS